MTSAVSSVNQGSDWSSVKILTPNPILGYGYPEEDLWRGVKEHHADAIIVDGGSTDGGPDDLALNHTVVSREMYVKDLTPMVQACYEYGVKIMIGTAGGAGTATHVDFINDVVEEIIETKGYQLTVAKIYSDVSKETVLKKLRAGRTSPCGLVPELTEHDVERSDQIVCQIGHEPYLKALQHEPDIIIGGRSYDPAPFIAYSLHKLGRLSHAIGWHMGKIMECGGICAIPKGKVILATVRPDSFDLLPMDPHTRCTELSVAAHTLYEKTRPDLLAGPGGLLDLTQAKYEQISERGVRVSGALIRPAPTTFKLEGACRVGYKTVFICGVRDPILIAGIEDFTQHVWDLTARHFPVLKKDAAHHKLLFKFYGKNAVMGQLEPNAGNSIHEIGLYGEVLAPTQHLANVIANCARVGVLHGAYPKQVATAGNIASPGTPLELAAGIQCEFTVYHLMEIDDPADFPILSNVVGMGSSRPRITNGVNGNGVNGDLHEAPYIAAKISSAISLHRASNSTIPLRLPDLARVVRSKNSGPYEITFDVMFATLEDYEYVQSLDVLNREFVKSAWKLQDDDIITEMWFKPALAWKATTKRLSPYPQGSFGDSDTFGAQYHAPLMELVLPA